MPKKRNDSARPPRSEPPSGRQSPHVSDGGHGKRRKREREQQQDPTFRRAGARQPADVRRSDRPAHHGCEHRPRIVFIEDPRGRVDDRGQHGQPDAQGRIVDRTVDRFAIVERDGRQDVERHEQRRNQEQPAARRLEPPVFERVETGPVHGGGCDQKDGDRKVGDRLFERRPEADHKSDRAADDQQAAQQLAPADVLLLP